MRDPAWNDGKEGCTLLIHPTDAEKIGVSDGQMVKIATKAGEEEIVVEVTENARVGQVVMPHGFGMVFQGKKYGANGNRLAKNTHRDKFAATPLHKYIPCRVEPT